MANIVIATASVYLATNPDTYRSLNGVKNVVTDLASGTFNLVGAAYNRSTEQLKKSVISLGSAPVHAADAVVYATAIVVPLPISRVWRTLRWQE